MTINDIFNFVSYVSNKYQAGNLSPDDFNLSCQVVSVELFNVKIGLPEAYKMGAPYPPQAYEVTQKIKDDMRNFVTLVPIQVANTGYFPYPTDYAAFSALNFDYIVSNPNGPTLVPRKIDVLTDGEFNERLENSIVGPTMKRPIAVYQSPGILVRPIQVKTINLVYLRYPVIPVFGYNVVNDEYIYDPLTSTQTDFPETLHSEFSMRIVRYLSINISDTELEQAALQRLGAGQ